jgi:hypothetical protein
MELFILSGVVVVLFATMIAHYAERGQFMAALAVRDERITRLFVENKALENISQELINAKSN